MNAHGERFPLKTNIFLKQETIMQRISLCLTLLFVFGPRVSAQPLKERLTLESGPIGAFALSGDGKMLATGHDKTIKLWDTTTGKEVRTLKEVSGSLIFSRDGRTLAVSAVSGAVETVQLWDVAAGKVKDMLKIKPANNRPIALTTDGTGLVYIAYGRTEKEAWTEVRLLDVTTKKERVVSKLGTRPANPEPPDEMYFGTCLAISADGKTLAMGNAFPFLGHTDQVSLLPLASGKESGVKLSAKLGSGECLAISDDDKILVAAGKDRIFVHDLASGKELAALKGFDRFAISAEGMTLASVRPNNTVQIWNVRTGHEAKKDK